MPNYSYVRLFADDDGESHFEDISGELTSTDFAPPASPTFIGGMQSAKNALFFASPPDWEGDWHPVPARQFMTILKGVFEVTVSDGETRTFGPGDIALVEDVTGKGHYTKNGSGEGENLLLVTQLADQ
jgi:hypothetical protein